MNNEKILKFNDKGLFNYEILHQYDEEGQKMFLGYLIISELWEIQKNNIVFPCIKTKQEVQKAIEQYNETTMRANLIIKQKVIDDIYFLGKETFRKQVNETLNKLDNKPKREDKDVR